MMKRSLILLLFSPLFVNGQQTFQQFRFDLDPNLPAEEPDVLAQLERGPRKAKVDFRKPAKKIEVQLKRDAFRSAQSLPNAGQINVQPAAQNAGPPIPPTNVVQNLAPNPLQTLPQQVVAPTQPAQQQFLPNLQQPAQILPQPAFGQQFPGFQQQQHQFLQPYLNQQPLGFGSQLGLNQQGYQQLQPFAYTLAPPPQFFGTTTTPIAANPAKTPVPRLPDLIPRQPVRINSAPADLATPDVAQLLPTAVPATKVQAVRSVSPQNKGAEVVSETQEVSDEIVEVASVREVPSSSSLWFKENFDTSNCRSHLSSIGHKFKSKFPSSVASRTKDAKLADLVQDRLIECDKKLQAGHWEKVNSLLGKISTLSKSEEADCRSGLIQEQISCQNLLNTACQFVEPGFQFRLVPARIIIQEARHAESGSDKCRNVVRTVKQRLGQ